MPARPVDALRELRITDRGLGQAPITAEQPVKVAVILGVERILTRPGEGLLDADLQPGKPLRQPFALSCAALYRPQVSC